MDSFELSDWSTQLSVVRMPCESVIPSRVRVLVLGAESGQLSRVHPLEVRPDEAERGDEEDVRVDVEDGLDVTQDALKPVEALSARGRTGAV